MVARDTASSEDMANLAFTAEQRAAVFAELELILSDPIFKTSNRCVALLRYVVIRTLENDKEGFKERLLGVEVFGRSTDYDVAADPIVRRVANEIRKRLAQYYQEPGKGSHVRIRLDRGGYLPEFEFLPKRTYPEPTETKPGGDVPELREYAKAVGDVPDAGQIVSAGLEKRPERPTHGRRVWLLGIAAVLLVLGISLWFSRLRPATAPESRVWKPLLDSNDTILVALPIRSAADESGASSTDTTHNDRTFPAGSSELGPSTLFRDVYAGTTITTRLSKFNKASSLRPSSALKFRDFQQNPAVLIGGLNNPWVGTFLSSLRFTLQYDPVTRDAWVQDDHDPVRRDWKIDGRLRSEGSSADYAVITRLFNPQTSQWLLALGGLRANGTEAAAELVADPKFARFIPKIVSDHGNFQVVLKTSVIGGEPGPLQVLAVQTW